jgi:exonuclease VII small subunit
VAGAREAMSRAQEESRRHEQELLEARAVIEKLESMNLSLERQQEDLKRGCDKAKALEDQNRQYAFKLEELRSLVALSAPPTEQLEEMRARLAAAEIAMVGRHSITHLMT